MASFFGIQTWFYKNVSELSGGQKQLLNLASVMAMSPSVLILDEPTSQLDPIAASDFLATLGKINRELGTTIILTEHRLEEAFPLASTVAVMDKGKLLCTGSPKEVGTLLKDAGHAMFLAMPSAMRVWAAVENEADCPITVREGRDWLTEYAATNELKEPPADEVHSDPFEVVISAEELWFKYEKDLPDVVKGLSLKVKKGEFLALLGGNGTGKTTSLKLLAGRAAFFMLPQFKPIMALVIIAGVAFGGETGFLVGAMTMLASNVMFSQGPWTPWQMFCMGIIGFLAGVLFRKGWLRRSRTSLCVFGALSAIVIYGGIMNPASALMWTGEINRKIMMSYYISGLPMDCVHAAATWLFLWFAAEPMLEKLDRVKVKYGLCEI